MQTLVPSTSAQQHFSTIIDSLRLLCKDYLFWRHWSCTLPPKKIWEMSDLSVMSTELWFMKYSVRKPFNVHWQPLNCVLVNNLWFFKNHFNSPLHILKVIHGFLNSVNLQTLDFHKKFMSPAIISCNIFGKSKFIC